MTSIRDCLYLGDKRRSADSTWLETKGIKLVINCSADLPNVFESDTSFSSSSSSSSSSVSNPTSTSRFKYVRIPLVDVASTDLLSEVRSTTALEELASAMVHRSPALVHCQAGSSRSVSVLLIHLMSYERLSLREAKELVSDLQPIKPNSGFMQQLIEIERELLGSVSL